MAPEPVFQFPQTPATRPAFRKKRGTDVFEGVGAGPPDDDLVAFRIPLQYRPRTNAEPTPHFSRDGDLPLCGEFRLSDWHDVILPR